MTARGARLASIEALAGTARRYAPSSSASAVPSAVYHDPACVASRTRPVVDVSAIAKNVRAEGSS